MKRKLTKAKMAEIDAEVDQIGVPETTAVANERFLDLVKAYAPLAADYETYVGYLEPIKLRVLKETAGIWVGKTEWHDKWWKRICEPAIDSLLTQLVIEVQDRKYYERIVREAKDSEE